MPGHVELQVVGCNAEAAVRFWRNLHNIVRARDLTANQRLVMLRRLEQLEGAYPEAENPRQVAEAALQLVDPLNLSAMHAIPALAKNFERLVQKVYAELFTIDNELDLLRNLQAAQAALQLFAVAGEQPAVVEQTMPVSRLTKVKMHSWQVVWQVLAINYREQGIDKAILSCAKFWQAYLDYEPVVNGGDLAGLVKCEAKHLEFYARLIAKKLYAASVSLHSDCSLARYVVLERLPKIGVAEADLQEVLQQQGLQNAQQPLTEPLLANYLEFIFLHIPLDLMRQYAKNLRWFDAATWPFAVQIVTSKFRRSPLIVPAAWSDVVTEKPAFYRWDRRQQYRIVTDNSYALIMLYEAFKRLRVAVYPKAPVRDFTQQAFVQRLENLAAGLNEVEELVCQKVAVAEQQKFKFWRFIFVGSNRVLNLWQQQLFAVYSAALAEQLAVFAEIAQEFKCWADLSLNSDVTPKQRQQVLQSINRAILVLSGRITRFKVYLERYYGLNQLKVDRDVPEQVLQQLVAAKQHLSELQRLAKEMEQHLQQPHFLPRKPQAVKMVQITPEMVVGEAQQALMVLASGKVLRSVQLDIIAPAAVSVGVAEIKRLCRDRQGAHQRILVELRQQLGQHTKYAADNFTEYARTYVTQVVSYFMALRDEELLLQVRQLLAEMKRHAKSTSDQQFLIAAIARIGPARAEVFAYLRHQVVVAETEFHDLRTQLLNKFGYRKEPVLSKLRELLDLVLQEQSADYAGLTARIKDWSEVECVIMQHRGALKGFIAAFGAVAESGLLMLKSKQQLQTFKTMHSVIHTVNSSRQAQLLCEAAGIEFAAEKFMQLEQPTAVDRAHLDLFIRG